MADAVAFYHNICTPLRNIHRFQQLACNKPQSVAEHSYAVAMLVGVYGSQLAELGVPFNTSAAMVWGLWHDAAEAAVGDMPHQVKRQETVKAAMADIERAAFHRARCLAGIPAGADIPGQLERDVVKMADWAELALYVLEERETGNRGLHRAYLKVLDLMVGPWRSQMARHGVTVEKWYLEEVSRLDAAWHSPPIERPYVFADDLGGGG